MVKQGAQRGCIHIYTGDGKGKTTAAVGLAVRFAGNGGKVLFTQFLKDGSSGEICVLKENDHITVFSFAENLGFSFQMNEKQKEYATECYTKYLRQSIEMAEKEQIGLLVLDEALAAYNLGFVDRDLLLSFLKNKREEMEVVLTGRDPAPELLELADYVSDIRKIKHPYDEGILAREGIEY